MIDLNKLIPAFAMMPTSQPAICGRCGGRGVVPDMEIKKVKPCPDCKGTGKEK